MNPALKVVLALVFVAVMGFVLIQPVLDSVGDKVTEASLPAPEPETEPTDEEPSPAPSTEPEPTPSAEPSPDNAGEITGAFRTQPLFDRYPDTCLKGSTASDGEALIATLTGRRIGFGTTAGPTDPGPPGGTRPLPARRFLGFNRSHGLYAATDGKRVVISPPEGVQGADGDGTSGSIVAVAWSPTSPCGLSLGRDGSLSSDFGVLVREDVRDFAYSPDGRRMAVVLREETATSVWVADLTGTTMREIQREPSRARISLRGWSPDGRTLYLTTAPGGGLSFVSATAEPPRSGRIGSPAVSNLEQCSGRLLGIAEGGIAEVSPQGLDYLTDPGSGYTAVSCSTDGGFLAAIRSDDLFLLGGDGSLIRDLTLDSGYRDVSVDWGPSGAGLIFGRIPNAGGDGQVWYIPEGSTARSTGVSFTPGPGAIDWSATPPTGLAQR